MTDLKQSVWHTEVDVPKALQELHGERTRVSTLVIVYVTALACAGLVAWQLVQSGLPIWKVALAALIFLDVGGGVAANLSAATNHYYQEHDRLRLPFIAMHIIHPAVLAVLFPTALPYFLYVLLFTLSATITVNAIKDRELQQNIASFLVVVGCALSFFFPQGLPVLYLFAPLFMVKLILGFAVRRTPLV